MVKNHLEKKFSESYKAQGIWGMKLHNNPLAHQTTPADYILDYYQSTPDGRSLTVALIECKQVSLKSNSRLTFKRLKQMHSLISFENNKDNHISYFCIAYYTGFWATSDVYLISAVAMKEIVDTHPFKSLNHTDAIRILRPYKLAVNKGVLNIWEKLK